MQEYVKVLDIKRNIIRKPLTDSEGNMLFGQYDNENNIIYLNSNIFGDIESSTLLHEILEILNISLELDLTHNQISCIESGLFSAGVRIKSRRNPKPRSEMSVNHI